VSKPDNNSHNEIEGVLEERLRLMLLNQYGAVGEKLSQLQMQSSSLRLSSVKRFEQGEIEARQRIARPKKSGRHPDRQELLARLRLERILPCTPDQRVQTLRQRNRSDRLRGEVPVMFRWQSTSYWSRDERSGLSDV
jgi:hypothetical protein